MQSRFWLYILATLILLSGCRMCSSPYDYCGPTFLGHSDGSDCHSCSPVAGRAGSAIAPSQDLLMTADETSGASGDVEETVSEEDTATASEFRPAPAADYTTHLRSPYTITHEPVIDFGVPPENIISITDRKLEAPPTESTTAPKDASVYPATNALATQAEASAPATQAEGRPLAGRGVPDQGSSDGGWTACGNRPEMLR